MLLYRTVQERRRSSPDIETLAAYVRSILQTQCHWFIVDDLNHLKRGGRVSATAAFVGTMLGIKPVMHTDSEGRLIPMSKARGTKAALKALVDKVEEYRATEDSMRAALLTAQKMASTMVEEAEAKKAHLIANAEAEARNKIGALQEELLFEQKRLNTAKSATAEFISKSRAVCEAQLKLLEQLPGFCNEYMQNCTRRIQADTRLPPYTFLC